MNIVVINPRYPYGKDQVYLNGSVTSIAARLLAMGHETDIVDLNIDRITDTPTRTLIHNADIVGISLTGAPHIPGVIELVGELREIAPSSTIMIGGQVIERLSTQHFRQVFGDTPVQIRDDACLANLLRCNATDIPQPEAVTHTPVYQRMGESRVLEYLRQEMTLVVSQGCHFKCAFCAASKQMSERFRLLEHFRADLEYLVSTAKKHGVYTLHFYSSSLDFFQTPGKLRGVLETLAEVQETSGVKIRVRCLSCMTSFLEARRQMKDFNTLVRRAGVWCVGFGSDGTDEEVWKTEQKGHNTVAKLVECVETCHAIGLRAELLMVFGFPEDTLRTLWKTVATCIWAVSMWDNVIVRPYLAKPFVPGNKGWKVNEEAVDDVVRNPRQFYNLDFCAIGSPLTHPKTAHRWQCNAVYLTLCALLTPSGRCTTSPLLPQGERGLYGALAKLINRFIPFDR